MVFYNELLLVNSKMKMLSFFNFVGDLLECIHKI